MKNLRSLRERDGYSQQKLADKLGLSQPQIHAYESGSYQPDIDTLIKAANFFNTSVDYLIGNTSIPEKYVPVSEYRLNHNESALVDKYRLLKPKQQDGVMGIVNAFLDEE